MLTSIQRLAWILLPAMLGTACQRQVADSSLNDAATYAGDIQISLAHPVNARADDFELLLSTPLRIETLAVCEMRAGVECKAGSPYRFDASMIYLTADRHFFKAKVSALLEDGLILKFEGADATGNVVDTRIVQLGRTDGKKSTAALPPSQRAAAKDTPKKINADRDEASANFGAGSGRATDYTKPASYTTTEINDWVKAHQAAKGPGYKYVFVPTESASDPELANVLRVAAAKAWNHLSWLSEIDLPEDVSKGAGLVFALNAAKVWGQDAETNWRFIANCSPKANIQISPAPRGECENFDPNAPVAIPRFVFNATNGGPYANIHKTPQNFNSFRNKFKMGPIEAVSTHKEAIVCGPRITAYRHVEFQGQKLLYSYTSDEFDGRDEGEIRYRQAPTDRDQRGTGALNAGPNDGSTAIASEWWIQLPNGFMYWGIHGEGSQERGKAEFPFAIDPANWTQNATLATGRSCITCHAAGTQSAQSDTQFAGKNGWTSNERLFSDIYNPSRRKFQTAMRALVDNLSDGSDELNERMVLGTVEPVAKAIAEIEGKYPGRRNGTCNAFCNGKFSERRANMCETIPTR